MSENVIQRPQNSPLVSVIVPVYKAEKYIKKCIESILCQAYENLEIILVNDGSPDGCPAICDEYAKKDPRIKVIHKKNGGVSSARNAGMENAAGEFIFFVDADDTIPQNAVNDMVFEMLENDGDLVIGSYNLVTHKGVFPKKYVSEVLDKEGICKTAIRRIALSGGVCAKFFKRDPIQRYNIIFDIDVPYAEDTLFVLSYLSRCKKVIYSDKLAYDYDKTISGSAASKFHKNFDIYAVKVFDEVFNVMENLGIDDKKPIISDVAAHYFSFCVYYYLTYTLNRKIMEEKILHLSNYFKTYTNAHAFDQMESKTFTETEVELLLKGDAKGFIKAWETNMKKNKFKQYLRLKVKLLLKKYNIIKR